MLRFPSLSDRTKLSSVVQSPAVWNSAFGGHKRLTALLTLESGTAECWSVVCTYHRTHTLDMQHVKESGKRAASDEQEPEECPVCFEPFSSIDSNNVSKRHRRGELHKSSPFKRREVFPCSHNHVFCVECSSKIDVCPLCREGRDGSSQDQRIAREQRERGSGGISVIAVSRSSDGLSLRGLTGTVVLPVPANLEHPFDANNVRVSVFAMPSRARLPNIGEIERAVDVAMQTMSGVRGRQPESIIHMLFGRPT
jgi:hypothetical protein